MAENKSTYWSDTDVLQTFMSLVYQKIKKMVESKLNSVGTIVTNAKNALAAQLSEMNKAVDAAETHISERVDAADASYNQYANEVLKRTETLNEAIMTQAEYDTLIGSYDASNAPNTPGTVTTAFGETWEYLPIAIMTPSQKLTLVNTGTVTTSYSGESKTWNLVNVGSAQYAQDANSDTSVLVDNVLGIGVFRTYYIIEETT